MMILFNYNPPKLRTVDFANVDCSSVVFSANDPFAGISSIRRLVIFEDCSFRNTNLSGAIFKGASLGWTKRPPRNHNYLKTNPETGQDVAVYESYGPFYQADLTGASFSKCVFMNADFRDAENILDADFSEATGLESAKFDTKKIRAAILKKTQKKAPKPKR